jgi:hypothetical protein
MILISIINLFLILEQAGVLAILAEKLGAKKSWE